MKKIYLIGGFGNNLFQVQKGLMSNEDIVYVVNIIKSKNLHKIIGWTYHEPTILSTTFIDDIAFVELPWIRVLFDFLFLSLSRIFNISIFGVSWEQEELTNTNFGYFQQKMNYNRWVEIECCLDNHDQDLIETPLVHVRMGDSPTLRQDLNKQINLMKKLGFNHYNIITNRPDEVVENFTGQPFSIDVVGGQVIDDFCLMRNAEILIIPQSTFSLFSALSNQNARSIYITGYKDQSFHQKFAKKVVHY